MSPTANERGARGAAQLRNRAAATVKPMLALAFKQPYPSRRARLFQTRSSTLHEREVR
jgi:hypothetical protein